MKGGSLYDNNNHSTKLNKNPEIAIDAHDLYCLRQTHCVSSIPLLLMVTHKAFMSLESRHICKKATNLVIWF